MEDKFLEVAKQAALEAGEIIASYFGKKHQYLFKNKDKSDYATQADLESEQKIVQILTKNFPEHNIIAEEKTRIDKGSEYTWVVDPLDGTTAFATGMPHFVVSIGLLKQNEPVLGVIYYVVGKDLYWGVKNKGAYINGKPIHVSKIDTLAASSVGMEFGHNKRRQPKIDLYILPVLRQAGYIYSLGSATLCLALVGKGVIDGAIIQAWIWDFAAGAIIVKEAGGQISNFEGKEVDWTKDRIDIVASNNVIHDKILEILKR